MAVLVFGQSIDIIYLHQFHHKFVVKDKLKLVGH